MTAFIFLHGSFHAAWNWHRVIPHLARVGHKSIALDLPGHGQNRMKPSRATLACNVDCVGAAIDALPADEEIVLVAHSRNGIVISQAAEARAGRIAGLVYLAAYLIPDGRSMMDYALLDPDSLVVRNIARPLPPALLRRMVRMFKSPLARAIGATLLPRKMQTHRLKREAYREALYHDCGEEIVELANALLEEEPNWAGFEPLSLSAENYGRVPKIYIECLRDRAVTLELQRRMQRDTPCDKIVSLDSSHSPFFSQAGKLAATLGECLEFFRAR